jgi:hypothetical protein
MKICVTSEGKDLNASIAPRSRMTLGSVARDGSRDFKEDKWLEKQG